MQDNGLYQYDYVLYVWFPKNKEYVRYQRYDSVYAMAIDLKLLVEEMNINKFQIFRYKRG